MTIAISAANVRTPRGVARLFTNFALAYKQLAGNIEWFQRCQIEDGVTGEPITMLATMHDRAIIAMHVMENVAARALAHADHLDNTVGAKSALVGTQAGGGYTDVTAR